MGITNGTDVAAAQPGRDVRRTTWGRGAFRWVDPESGQSLRVELSGPRELLAGLQEKGFELEGELEGAGAAPAVRGGGVGSAGIAGGRARLENDPEG